MIALLIGGTVVLCAGLLTVVFGIPIKEFSFGNTMILAGAVVSCTGLILIGLYFVGREFRNMANRLEAGVAAPVAPSREAAASREAVTARETATAREAVAAPSPRSPQSRDDRLFSRDQPQDRDESADALRHDDHGHAPSRQGPNMPPAARQDHPAARSRHPAPPAESFDPPVESAEPPRRNIMFSSHRRTETKDHDLPPHDPSRLPPDDDARRPSAEDYQQRDAEPQPVDPFDSAWPQPSRPRPESSVARNGRVPPPAVDRESPEPARERFQPPRRAEASSVTIVKSGVVDSMAYSLYSDGSIEAQMPEGMVRFASIEELRAHLDDRA